MWRGVIIQERSLVLMRIWFFSMERLNFKQYIKTKRARFGIKFFQVVYLLIVIVLDYIIYHGNMAPQLVEMEENSLTTNRIPATLMKKYLGKKVIICTLTTTTLEFLFPA